MRTASELVRATKQFAREDWRSWWHLWSTLAVLSILLAVTCLDAHWLIRLICSIAAGLVLVRMFIIYHDYQHGTILRGSWLAHILMTAYGLLTLSPPSIWNRTHNHHHKHNARMLSAGIGSFPLMTTVGYAKASGLQRFSYAAARHPLTILFGYFTVFFYGMCLRSLLSSPRQHADSGVAMVLHLGLAILLAIHAPGVLLFTMLLPCMVATALGAYLFYAQHNSPGLKIQEQGDWDYVFASLNSSSYIAMSPVMCWLTGNIGYHHVHHLNARIPFYRLPEAMAALTELQSPVTTSLTPLDIRRCLRLKLWNPETRSLVTFNGM